MIEYTVKCFDLAKCIHVSVISECVDRLAERLRRLPFVEKIGVGRTSIMLHLSPFYVDSDMATVDGVCREVVEEHAIIDSL